MAVNDEPARIARAKRIRQNVDQLLGRGGEATTPPTEAAAKSAAESPRDFIQRRMHELNKGNQPAQEG
jgi:hypothetical protein